MTISADDIAAAVAEAGGRADDTVWVHAALGGSGRVAGDTRQEKMETVIGGLGASAAALWMPTFSYSFTNGEDFEPATAKSKVGKLTDHFRQRDGVRRTIDPIFSAAVDGGAPEHLFRVRDQSCFGPESVFAHLEDADALLVFYDVDFEVCTYIHLVEQALPVPYRYLKPFAGDVVVDGTRTAIEAQFFVRKLDEDVVTYLTPLWEHMTAAGAARTVEIDHGPAVRAVRARAVTAHASERIAAQPDYLLKRGHE